MDVTGAPDVDTGIRELLAAGAGAVVTSLGPEGLLLGTSDPWVTCSLGRPLVGNPTGAGDAVVAALAAGLANPTGNGLVADLVAALPHAVGWSAAAVLSPVAGEIDTRVADRFATESPVRARA
jgi:fructose-1-phosphate kinase PfkB-like protein